jgi:putative flippase GtrA
MTHSKAPPEAKAETNSAGRYMIVAVVAFLTDLALAMILREGLGLPVWLAAAISFIVVGAAAYFVHEHWTFRHAESRTSASRFARNMAALLAAFLTRVCLIAAMEAVHDPEALLAAVYIGIGAVASLTVNFLLNRFWVFQRKG